MAGTETYFCRILRWQALIEGVQPALAPCRRLYWPSSGGRCGPLQKTDAALMNPFFTEAERFYLIRQQGSFHWPLKTSAPVKFCSAFAPASCGANAARRIL